MIYLCYDTALNEEYTLIRLLQKYPDCISLFKGTDDENIWDAAPYLFQVDDNFYELRKDALIQLDHCILFETKETKEEVCRFLQYYMYKKESDRTSYFRIWDARVLTKHLPEWDEKERLKFFDFFQAVYTEQANREGLDKWQLARFNKPAAVPILKTDILSEFVSAADNPVAQPSADISTPAVEKREPKTDNEIQDTASPSPRKRRFFIE